MTRIVEEEQLKRILHRFLTGNEIKEFFLAAKDIWMDKDKFKQTLKKEDVQTDVLRVFQTNLYALRLEMGHRNMTVIGRDNPQYAMLGAVAKQAFDFAERFEFEPIEEGVKVYCKMGLQLFGKKQFALSKFRTYDERINNIYACRLIINQDEKNNETNTLFFMWQNKMIKIIGSIPKVEENYEKYVCFVYARQQADEKKADYADWINAQFSWYEAFGEVPEPYQLYGERAELNYMKFMGRKNLALRQEDDTAVTVYGSEEEKQYWEMLRKGDKINGNGEGNKIQDAKRR